MVSPKEWGEEGGDVVAPTTRSCKASQPVVLCGTRTKCDLHCHLCLATLLLLPLPPSHIRVSPCSASVSSASTASSSSSRTCTGMVQVRLQGNSFKQYSLDPLRGVCGVCSPSHNMPLLLLILLQPLSVSFKTKAAGCILPPPAQCTPPHLLRARLVDVSDERLQVLALNGSRGQGWGLVQAGQHEGQQNLNMAPR